MRRDLVSLLVVVASLSAVGCSGSVTSRDPDAAAIDAAAIDADSLDAALLDVGWIDEDAGSPADAGVAPDAADAIDAAVAPHDAATPPAPDASAPPGPTSTERTVRIFHWNIAGGKENDCRADLIARAVRRFVREHDVDFVGLNEVCPAQHDAIERALRAEWSVPGGVAFAAFVGDGTPRIVGNSIFSRFGFVGGSVSRLEVGSDQYGSRNLICAQIRGLPHLRQCATHLSPNATKAPAQLARVLARIEGFWTGSRDTVFLTGDLNLRANADALDTVYSAAANTPNNPGNRGSYRELDDDDPAHCRGYGERSVRDATGGPCGEGAKIDFIFVRQNRIVDGDYAGDTFNIPTDCTGICSDHRPVFGRVRVRVALD